MAVANRLAGTATLTIDGVSFMITKTQYMCGKVTREALKGQDGIHGYSEMPQVPYIKGTFRDARFVSLTQINAITNSTAILVLANGKTIIGTNVFTSEAQEVDTVEGTFDVTFNAMQMDEQQS